EGPGRAVDVRAVRVPPVGVPDESVGAAHDPGPIADDGGVTQRREFARHRHRVADAVPGRGIDRRRRLFGVTVDPLVGPSVETEGAVGRAVQHRRERVFDRAAEHRRGPWGPARPGHGVNDHWTGPRWLSPRSGTARAPGSRPRTW